MTSFLFATPWECLIEPEPSKIESKSIPQSIPKAQKTFAQALNNACDIPLSQLPKPTLKGNEFSIPIPEEEYLLGIENCKNNLHARIIWPKGATPLTVLALKEKLRPMWKNLGPWGIQFISRGYYEFAFSSIEDACSVRSVGTWVLNLGLLKLFTWTKDFSPSRQNNTFAQVWVRIYGLSQEYWRKKILCAIASGVGSPISIDSAVSKPIHERTFGHYARVLVDMDLSKEIRYKLLVERKGFAFFVDLDYENLPHFCEFCKNVGHHVKECRRVKAVEVDKGANDKNLNNANGKKPMQEYMQVNDKRGNTAKSPILVDLQVQSSNAQSEPVVVGKNGTRQKEHTQSSQNSKGDEDIELQPNLNNEVEQDALLQVVEHGAPKNFVPSQSDKDSVSSHASEFVEATQQLTDGESQDSSQKTSTPIRIQQDMNFLKESWANLAEDEVEDQLQDMEITQNLDLEKQIDEQIAFEDHANLQASGFKLVTHRKRSQSKSSSSSGKKSYATRSKGVSIKPFR